MNAQQVFDKIVKGIIKQGGPSLDSKGKCLYHGNNGRKCAAGQLISKKIYKWDMEGIGISGLINNGEFKLPLSIKDNEGLCKAMQMVHDQAAVNDFGDNPTDALFLETFKREAKIIATNWNLKWNFD